MTDQTIDPITFELFKNAIFSIADEMALTVFRTTYSAVGNQTNLTARIQDHCVPGKVLISHTTWALVKDQISCEERGEIEVKGKGMMNTWFLEGPRLGE